jgi:hypothetical protein
MSLDIYLISDKSINNYSTGIYIRENGKTVELSIERARELYPEVEIQQTVTQTTEVFHSNITHNLANMATKAGLYKYLWRANEQANIAKDLVENLTSGLKELKDNPEIYSKYNPENGWGNYDLLVQFVEEFLQACIKYPNTTIEVSR